jgi:putative two-component system response regulator
MENENPNVNQNLNDISRRMACLAEFYKPGIEKHIDRIRGYSYIIAQGVGLPDDDAEIISLASQLHDVGMVGIPKNVIKKTGELTYDEWELIKKHPEIGAEVLNGASSPILQLGEVIALSHHERWDGSGYPKRLTEENIPLAGRVCGLADVFDAITTERAYGDQVSAENALELIVESGGLFFDPKLVKAFSDNFSEILKVRQENI